MHEEWRTWLVERRRFIVVCVWPSRSFKRGTLEVFFPGHVVSICQQLLWYFLPVFHPKKKKLSLFIELTERRVGGQRYFIIALELEKSVTGWQKPFIRPCLLCSFDFLPTERQTASGMKRHSELSFAFSFPSMVAGCNPRNSLWNLICGDNTKLR